MHVYIYKWYQTGSPEGETLAFCWSRYHPESGTWDDSPNVLLRISFPSISYCVADILPEDLTPEMEARARDIVKAAGLDVNVSIDMMRTTDYYQEEPSTPTFVLMSYSHSDLQKAQTLLRRELGFSITAHETAVTNGRKLTAMIDAPQYGWFELDADNLTQPEGERISKDHVAEYNYPFQLLNPAKDSVTWQLNQLVAGWDIEAYKPSERMGMPDPRSPTNYCFQISFWTKRASNPDSLQMFQVTLGGFDPHSVPKDSQNWMFDRERDLLAKFMDIWATTNPDVLAGFNTHSWDFAFVDSRLKINGLEWSDSIGLLKKNPIGLTEYTQPANVYGNNMIKFKQATGQVIFDIHKYAKRMLPKLPRHNLETVSQTLIGRGKLDMSQKSMVESFEDYWLARGRHGTKLRGDTADPVINEISPEDAAVNGIDVDTLESYGLVAAYNHEDSALVLDLMLEGGILNQLMAEAEITETDMEYLHTKGMQIRVFSLLYREAKRIPEDKFIVSRRKIDKGFEPKGAEIGEVLEGYHSDVTSIDVKSEYPSILSHNNICYTTVIDPLKVSLYSPDDIITLPSVSTRNDIIDVSFVRGDIREGLCSRVIRRLMGKREEIQEILSRVSDKMIREKLNAMQESIKIDMNALPGMMAMGGYGALLPFPEGAGVVFTQGRELITKIRDRVESTYGKVVNLDTDGMILKLYSLDDSPPVPGNIRAHPDLARLSREMVDSLNTEFSPFHLKLECMGVVFVRSKKNYVLWPYDCDGRLVEETKIVYKGIQAVKRETCSLVCRAQSRMSKAILQGVKPEDLRILVLNEIVGLLARDVDPKELVMANRVGENYTQKSHQMNIFSNRLRVRGDKVEPGDLLEYIVVNYPEPEEPLPEIPVKQTKTAMNSYQSKLRRMEKKGLQDKWGKTKTLVGEKMVTPTEYRERFIVGSPVEVDKRYYLERLAGCLDSMFKPQISSTENLEVKGVGFGAEGCYSANPVADVLRLLKEGQTTIEALDRQNEENLEALKEREDPSGIVVRQLILA